MNGYWMQDAHGEFVLFFEKHLHGKNDLFFVDLKSVTIRRKRGTNMLILERIVTYEMTPFD